MVHRIVWVSVFSMAVACSAPRDAMVRTGTGGGDWAVDGQGTSAQHFSPLTQIADSNVGRLGLAWSLDITSPMGLAAEPIVVDGVMYVTSLVSRVYAVDVATGTVRWQFDPHIAFGESTQNSYAARVNRGVAVADGRVFVGTGDCRLIAIDAASGAQLWASPICDPKQTGTTAAPHVAAGNVMIGYNGSDDKVRGSIVAFDAKTGKEAWRFWTVPGDPATSPQSPALALAAKTWTGRGWSTVGGGNVWDPVTYDSATGLLLFGTAGAGGGEGTNPGPIPGGDKLFSGCIVAVNPATGAYVWHFQTGAADITRLLATFPENMHIVLADLVVDGRTRHVAMTVPKSGIFYVIDARSGALISATPMVDVPWARFIDVHTGRVIGTPASAGPQWTVHNWWHMSYSPRTGLVYVPVTDRRDTTFDGKLIAWDPVARVARWSVEHPLAVNSSVLSTAGNLVFQGQGTGEFDAYAASDGRRLWSIQTGSAIDATPVSVSVKGKQFILVPVGWGSASRLFGPARAMATPESKRGPSRVLAFALGATRPFPTPRDVVPAVPDPPRQTFSAAMVEKGARLYETHLCSGCHSPGLDGSGAWTVDGAVPDLRYAPPDVHAAWRAIVLQGTHRAAGMVAFGVDQHFPDVARLSAEEADAIHAYVIDAAWKAYTAQQRQIMDARRRD